MKKFFNLIWLPALGVIFVIAIFGSAGIAESQSQKSVANQRIIELEKQIDDFQNQLEAVKNIGPTERIIYKTKTITKYLPAEELSALAAASPSSSSASTTPSPITIAPRPSEEPIPPPAPIPSATVEVAGLNSYQVELQNSDSAFDILLRAGEQHGFRVDYQDYGAMGMFVTCIAGICSHDNYYWAFYYNGAYSMVGASSQPVSDGDITAWQFKQF